MDYEKQKSYSLTLEAKDGGGRITTVNILVHLADVNDNAPVFESSEYRRTVREGATTFQPQFFVKVILNFTIIGRAKTLLSYYGILMCFKLICISRHTRKSSLQKTPWPLLKSSSCRCSLLVP